jgi:mannose-6-phosphate isomerase-like protein (cupin superfamily)
MEKINVQEKFSKITEHWSPAIIGSLNNQDVKIAKIKGEFIWHSHENEDELFLVIKGWFDLQFRDKTVRLKEGEICIVPKGVEHRPVAVEECQILMFEPQGTLNTGNITNERTKEAVKL